LSRHVSAPVQRKWCNTTSGGVAAQKNIDTPSEDKVLEKSSINPRITTAIGLLYASFRVA